MIIERTMQQSVYKIQRDPPPVKKIISPGACDGQSFNINSEVADREPIETSYYDLTLISWFNHPATIEGNSFLLRIMVPNFGCYEVVCLQSSTG
jgi:hypothetical protein